MLKHFNIYQWIRRKILAVRSFGILQTIEVNSRDREMKCNHLKIFLSSHHPSSHPLYAFEAEARYLKMVTKIKLYKIMNALTVYASQYTLWSKPSAIIQSPNSLVSYSSVG